MISKRGKKLLSFSCCKKNPWCYENIFLSQLNVIFPLLINCRLSVISCLTRIVSTFKNLIEWLSRLYQVNLRMSRLTKDYVVEEFSRLVMIFSFFILSSLMTWEKFRYKALLSLYIHCMQKQCNWATKEILLIDWLLYPRVP